MSKLKKVPKKKDVIENIDFINFNGNGGKEKEANKSFRSIDYIKFRTKNQELYWKMMSEKEIVLCSGPAGTGKSYLSLAKALQLHSKESKKYKKIIIIKPAVEADEKLGFLPGTFEEKLEPYIYSTKYILEKILEKRKVAELFDKGKIEIMALAYIRGINIDNSILILEEAQNCTKKQIRTLLTRIGENSKFIISGDLDQVDRNVKVKDTGLYLAMEKLFDIPGIGIFKFNDKDIIRNPLITPILERLNGEFKN